MKPASLVLFDVDGTLVDSQAQIVAAFTEMYAVHERPPRERDVLLSVVGLSLPVAISRLEPDLSAAEAEIWAEAYRSVFGRNRARDVPSPLYPGARDALERLGARAGTALGVATGKSRRGLVHVLAAHELSDMFATCQTADDHPSKPHPAMVEAALAETGVPAHRAVLVGDTTFDIEMGRAAGVATIGVSWGYHPADRLRAAGADSVVDRFDALEAAIAGVTEVFS